MVNQCFILKSLMVLAAVLTAAACGASAAKDKRAQTERLAQMPPVMLWAWERPEDLEFADSQKYGVAYLAQTLELNKDVVLSRSRRQPLRIRDNAFLMAVTRIESARAAEQAATLSNKQGEEIVERVLKTVEKKGVRAVQIDFDAAVSEREFYRAVLINLRAKLPADVPLSITALASFCLGDRWFKDLPVDEAVPMMFRMGLDSANIRGTLASGVDFKEPLCQTSYGIATDEPLKINFNTARRLYIFNSRPWTPADLEKTSEIFRHPAL